MPSKKKLVGDTAWAFGAKVGAGGGQILIGILLAKILSPNDFGQFQVVQRIILFASVLGSLGLGWVAARLVAESVAKSELQEGFWAARKIIAIVFSTAASLGILVTLFGNWISTLIFDFSLSGVAFIVGLTIVAASIQQIVPECFRGLHEIRFASIFSGLAINISFLVVVSLIWIASSKTGFSEALMAYSVASVFVVCVSSFLLYKHFGNIARESIGGGLGYFEIIKIGAPLLGSTLLLFVVTQADVWLVAALISNESAAYYAAASRLVFILTLPLMVANAVIKPIVSSMWLLREKERLQVFLRKTAILTMAATLVPTILVVFWPEDILRILFGDWYVQGSFVLQVLAMGQLAVVAFGPCAVLIVMAGKQSELLAGSFVGVFVFLIGVYVFFPLGAAGVAMGAVAGLVASQGYVMYICWRQLGIKTYIGMN